MNNAPFFLVSLAALGTVLVVVLLALRRLDQQRRDRRRVIALAQFPRSVTAEQVGAFLQALQGLAAAGVGLLGRDSVVLEVVGTHQRIFHRLRLPQTSATYFIGQLRAAVPGVTVTFPAADDPLAKLPKLVEAHELRLTDASRALSVDDPAAISRTILSACAELSKGEVVVWHWSILGGRAAAPNRPSFWLSLSRRALDVRSRDDDAHPTGRQRKDPAGVTLAVLRIGASAGTRKRAQALVAGLMRASASVSAPHVRLLPRRLPGITARDRLERGITPLIEAPLFSSKELLALLGWPIGGPVIPNLVLGGSPQLPVSPLVPRRGRILGDATVGGKPVAQKRRAALEHTLYLAPTGAGKSWLAANVVLGDITRGDGGLVVDPKGGTVQAILDRLPEEAIERTILVDPTDEARPVPLPLLSTERGAIPELAADTLVRLLRHRNREDLGPRSSDILTSSLYALARVPDATFMDLLRLWSDSRYRAIVAAKSAGDPVLASFFAWFDGLGAAERNFVLAAPMNKVRPLLQRSTARNMIAAPRATFTMAEALAKRQIVLVSLPEGVLGSDVTSLLGQVVIARLWSAIQGRSRLRPESRRPFFVTIDEAPRFIDQPTDLADVLARAREYGVGVTLIGQTLAQFPTNVREVALNSARTKVAFQSSAQDARRLAAEFGPTATPEMFSALAPFEAIGVVSLGGAVSEPFTFRTRPLPDKIPGRTAAVRHASRARWGIDRKDIEASFTKHQEPPAAPGGIGRRVER